MVFSDKGECDGKENEKGGANVQPFGFYAFVSVDSVLERHRYVLPRVGQEERGQKKAV